MSQIRDLVIPPFERPVRIPAAIPLEFAEPAVAVAGEVGAWRLPFRLAAAVAPGEPLKLQIFGPRNNRQGRFAAQVDDPAAEGFHICIMGREWDIFSSV